MRSTSRASFRFAVLRVLLISVGRDATYGETMRNAICLLISLAASTASAESINGQLVDTYTAFPIAGADVFVTGPHGLQATLTTDDGGHYLAAVDGPGTYYLTFASGEHRVGFKVDVATGGSTHFDAKLERDEVIEIHDIPKRRSPVLPTPLHPLPAIPKYSANMIETDAWVKVWFLLDIDEQGGVSRAKFLNHPGHDLEQIAIDFALALKFTPALDNLGHPYRTLIVYPVEWPSYWWMVAMDWGTAERMPKAAHVLHVPCVGSGPLHLDSKHPVYRDCTKPDLSHVAQESWFARKN